MSDIVEKLRGFWGDVSNRDIIEAAAEIERLRAALNKLIRFAQSLSEQASDMTCQYEAEEIYLHGVPQLLQGASGVIAEARAALQPPETP